MDETASAAVPGSRTEATDKPTDPPLAPEEIIALRQTGLTVSPVAPPSREIRSIAAVVQYAARMPPPSAAYISNGRTLRSLAPGSGSPHDRPVRSQVVNTSFSSGRSAAEYDADGPA